MRQNATKWPTVMFIKSKIRYERKLLYLFFNLTSNLRNWIFYALCHLILLYNSRIWFANLMAYLIEIRMFSLFKVFLFKRVQIQSIWLGKRRQNLLYWYSWAKHNKWWKRDNDSKVYWLSEWSKHMISKVWVN